MKGKGLTRGLTHYGDHEFSLYLRRAFMKSMGFSNNDLEKPIVGIANTYSDFNSCHRGFKELVETIKRGVWMAGGLPLEFPTISLGEPYLFPSSMMYRNLMAMDTEEMIRAQPMDAVVLMGGCDKTLPAQLMAAASCNIPAIAIAAGPMMTHNYKDERLGACTDCRRFWAAYRSGLIDAQTIENIESSLCTTAGTCMVMGTASTIACIVEAIGMMLPGGAAIPAVHADRLRHGELTGKIAVQMITEQVKPDRIITRKSIENAIRVMLAIGGSTNGIIHLTAIAGRLGIPITLDDLNRISDETPILLNMKPSGSYYMEDFFKAGGLPVILQELKPLLHLDCLTVTGRKLEDLLSSEYQFPLWQDVIKPLNDPFQKEGALTALHGSLAPDGAVIKRSAASPDLLKVKGKAVVFNSLEDLANRIDDPNLDVSPEDILVLKNAGPKGAPGMPEAGYLPIPKKLAKQGIKDMVRISDARMSGTAFGTIVLHIAPEAAVGGPLAFVENDDIIEMDVERKILNLLIDEQKFSKRKSRWSPPPPPSQRGYSKLYFDHVLQAHQGCDFDFLV